VCQSVTGGVLFATCHLKTSHDNDVVDHVLETTF
jgi:hypothetical protein